MLQHGDISACLITKAVVVMVAMEDVTEEERSAELYVSLPKPNFFIQKYLTSFPFPLFLLRSGFVFFVRRYLGYLLAPQVLQ